MLKRPAWIFLHNGGNAPVSGCGKNCVYSMLLAFFGVAAVYLFSGIYPFGNKTVITGDLGGIYMPAASHFGGYDGFFSSFAFSKGLGGGIQGLAANFPVSPYMLITKLIPAEGLGVFFTVTAALKIIAAAGTMCFYLCGKTRPSWYTAVLGFAYAFMSFNWVYLQNTMWADNIVLLPLILSAFDYMADTGKFSGLCLLLAFAVYSNYYTAYMICLFLTLYFLWEVIGRRRVRGAALLNLSARFLGSGLLAAGLSAAVMLPVAVQTLQNKGVGGGISGWAFNPAEFFRQFIYCGFTWDQLEKGPPIIYCGFLCLAGTVFYFVSKGRSSREKIFSASLVAVLTVSFLFAPLNRVWHLFRDPVWFPFRYSFLFAAVCVLFSAFALENTSKITKKTAALAGLALSAVFAAVVITQFGIISAKKILVTVAAAAAVFLLVCAPAVLKKEKAKRILGSALAVFVFAELSFNACYITGLFELRGNADMREYFNEVTALTSGIDDGGFYRVEKDDYFSLNDPMLLGYNGLNHFSSLADRTGEQIIRDLGYSGLYKTGIYAVEPANALLNLSYIISATGFAELAGYEETAVSGRRRLMSAKTTLPFAFYASETDAKLEDHPFKNIDRIYSDVLGENTDLLREAEYSRNGDSYTIDNFERGSYYAWAVTKNDGSFLSVNGVDYGKAEVTAGTMQIIPLGYHEENFSFALNCDNLAVYRLDNELFENACERIRTAAPKILEVSDGYIEIETERAGTVFFSMPYYGDWSAEMNGKDVNMFAAFGNFAAVEVEDDGTSVVILRYKARGASEGIIVTVLSAVVLAVWILRSRKSDKYVGQQAR